MKSAGLSSKFKKMFSQTTKMTAYATLHENHLGANEKQKFLRLQAERAQIESAKREEKLATEPVLLKSE